MNALKELTLVTLRMATVITQRAATCVYVTMATALMAQETITVFLTHGTIYAVS